MVIQIALESDLHARADSITVGFDRYPRKQVVYYNSLSRMMRQQAVTRNQTIQHSHKVLSCNYRQAAFNFKAIQVKSNPLRAPRLTGYNLRLFAQYNCVATVVVLNENCKTRLLYKRIGISQLVKNHLDGCDSPPSLRGSVRHYMQR